jgi:hypothetical protein
MAHFSGNATWTNTTATPITLTQLEAIENSIDTVHQRTVSGWQPPDHSWVAWSYDPVVATGSVGAGAGLFAQTGIQVSGTLVVTGIVVSVNTSNSTTIANQNWLGIYGSSGLVGATADQASTWTTTGTKVAALVGGAVSLTPGEYVVAFLTNMTSGSVGFAAAPGSTAAINANTFLSRSAFVSTSLTSLPSTKPSITTQLNPLWAALY